MKSEKEIREMIKYFEDKIKEDKEKVIRDITDYKPGMVTWRIDEDNIIKKQILEWVLEEREKITKVVPV